MLFFSLSFSLQVIFKTINFQLYWIFRTCLYAHVLSDSMRTDELQRVAKTNGKNETCLFRIKNDLVQITVCSKAQWHIHFAKRLICLLLLFLLLILFIHITVRMLDALMRSERTPVMNENLRMEKSECASDRTLVRIHCRKWTEMKTLNWLRITIK